QGVTHLPRHMSFEDRPQSLIDQRGDRKFRRCALWRTNITDPPINHPTPAEDWLFTPVWVSPTTLPAASNKTQGCSAHCSRSKRLQSQKPPTMSSKFEATAGSLPGALGHSRASDFIN